MLYATTLPRLTRIPRSVKVVIGGDTDESDRYIGPTVIDYGSDMVLLPSSNFDPQRSPSPSPESTKVGFHKSESMQDEIFGPVLPMVRYDDLDQLISLVNEKEKPLALYLFSSNAGLVVYVFDFTFALMSPFPTQKTRRKWSLAPPLVVVW